MTPADAAIIAKRDADLIVERDALRVRVAELERHVGSLHKAAARGMEFERATVVAWLLDSMGNPGCGSAAWEANVGAYVREIVAAIERGAHHAGEGRERP